MECGLMQSSAKIHPLINKRILGFQPLFFFPIGTTSYSSEIDETPQMTML